MHDLYLKIGPVSYHIHSENELVEHETCANFLVPEVPENTIDVELCAVDSLKEPRGKLIHQSSQRLIYLEENRLEHRVNLWGNQLLGISHERSVNNLIAEIPAPKDLAIPLSTSILEFLNLEKYLLCHEALVLHSSFIEYEGKAILFTAPSGTGKSTQANLWKMYEGTEIINGDRSIVHRTAPGVFLMHGLPFCGSSQIHLNKEMPLGAIVFIEQHPTNIVEPMSPAHAFGKLYGEMSINSWNIEAVEKGMQIIENLVVNIPMVHLMCNMEQDAVNTLKHYLHEKTGY